MRKGKEWALKEVLCDESGMGKCWTSIHDANGSVTVQRNGQLANRWRMIDVLQSKVIQDYNMYMNGVDHSDQILGKSSALRKCMRWWKTLFFHMIDIAVVNRLKS